jgi:hypothetical protein
MKKATVINALNELPKEFKLDELLERLLVLEKIEAGLKEAKSGKTVAHDRVKKMAAKWQK